MPLDTLRTAREDIDVARLGDTGRLNHDRTSFFRVIYNAEHLAKLAAAVKAGKLGELDRLGLFSDYMEAAKAGYTDTVNVLKLLESYADEDSTVVWDVISSGIGSIRAVMDDDAVREGLKPLLRQITARQIERLGWDEGPGDSHFDLLLRPTVLGLASLGENQDVMQEAKRRFKDMRKPEDVHPDLRGVVYGTIAREGGKAEFDKLLAMHDASTNSEERVTLAGAITGFKQPDLIKDALGMITTDKVRLQDVSYWIAYSFGNRHARRITWDWLVANWDWLVANIGSDLSFFRMPIYASRGFSDDEFLPVFRSFFESHMSPAFERPVNQGAETIQWQAAWKKRDLAAVKKYLAG